MLRPQYQEQQTSPALISQPTQSIEQPAFVGKLMSVRPLVSLLRAISFKDKAVLYITQSGIKLSADDAHCAQIHAYMQRSVFQEYSFRLQSEHDDDMNSTPAASRRTNATQSGNIDDRELVVGIHVPSFLDCLTLFSSGTAQTGPATSATWTATTGNAARTSAFGGSTAGPVSSSFSGSTVGKFAIPSTPYRGHTTTLRMTVDEGASQIELMLEDNGIVATCRLAAFEPELNLDIDFGQHELTHKLIIKSEWLRHAISSDLEASSERLILSIINKQHQPPHNAVRKLLRMTTIGHAGSTEIEFTGDTEVVESFYAATEEIEVTFRFAQVLNALKAMALSTKTSLRLNEAGVMALQFIIPVDRGEMCFVEFLCLPMIAETSG